MLGHLLGALFFAAGHLIRDGQPALGSTQAARALGAAVCALGAFLALGGWWSPLIVFGGVLLSFYCDQRHAAGQQARDWNDAGYLLLSGLSSSMALGFVLAEGISPELGIIVILGALKPGIWFLCRIIRPDRWWPWLYWTRAAAILFGAVLGGAL